MSEKGLIVHVGVSGHRFLENPERLRKSIRVVFERIYSLNKKAEFHLYSPLAAGADQLAAECGLENPHTQLIVILPVPIGEYVRDFSETQKRSFYLLYEKRKDVIELPYITNRDEAYLAAGRYIVDHSDYLIALWNGKPERGKGGTAQIVKYAKQKKIPTAWIRADNAVPGSAIHLDESYEKGSTAYLNWD